MRAIGDDADAQFSICSKNFGYILNNSSDKPATLLKRTLDADSIQNKDQIQGARVWARRHSGKMV
jgi:hypothetical protein